MNPNEYRDLVGRVMLDALSRRDGVARVFRNEGAGGASAVLDTMVAHAWSGLSAYTGSMSPDAWDADGVRALVEKDPGIRVRVLVEDPASLVPGRSALFALADLVESGRILVRSVGEGARPRAHLAVVDGRHVRVEGDPVTRRATAAFGDAGLGALATDVFDRAWGRGKDVPPATLRTAA